MVILEVKLASALHTMDNIRKQYAGIGYTYDLVNDVFIAATALPILVAR
jgi:hypothetical protein